MQNGFIYNFGKCVNCGACSAACVLENGWSIRPRKVFTYNSNALTSLPIINLSLACNHCEKAVCLEGCPVSAYYRDPETGAVIIDENKCIGCKYCQWNCPYDAPKFNDENKTVGKCNLCYAGLKEGRLPACSTSCPTGALSFGALSEPVPADAPEWFPDKNLNPAIELTDIQNINTLKVIPQELFGPEAPIVPGNVQTISDKWSLILFSFLTTLSVSWLIASLIKGKYPDLFYFISAIFLSGLISLFHLGAPLRAWRSLSNIKTSPLSREIALFSAYALGSITSVSFRLPLLLVISSILGLILLLAVDGVYVYSDNRKSVVLHSGQTFLSALLMISFFTGNIIPFLFIAIIKLAATGFSLYVNKDDRVNFGIRFLRMALLVVTGTSLIAGISNTDPAIYYIFLTGEVIDRIMFYIDFEPVNINNLINK